MTPPLGQCLQKNYQNLVVGWEGGRLQGSFSTTYFRQLKKKEDRTNSDSNRPRQRIRKEESRNTDTNGPTQRMRRIKDVKKRFIELDWLKPAT